VWKTTNAVEKHRQKRANPAWYIYGRIWFYLMATFKRFEEIVAWQMARQLAQEIERIARETGLAKDLRLRNQICDSSNPVLNNIAEGFGREGKVEFTNFLHIAHASCAVTQSQVQTFLVRQHISLCRARIDIPSPTAPVKRFMGLLVTSNKQYTRTPLSP
jgi:four helix bundle protein